MSQERSLVKNTFILGFGKLVTQIAAFALLPIYTIFLSPSDFGAIDLITVYVALLAPLLIVQLDRAAFRELIEARGSLEKSREVISNTLSIITPVLAAATLIYIAVCFFIDIPHATLIALAVLATILSTLTTQFARGLGRNDLFALASIVLGLSNFAVVAILIIWLKMGVAGVLVGLVASHGLASLFLFIKLQLNRYISFSKKNISKKGQKGLISFAWPLVPSAVSWWFIKTFDRTLITMIVGLTANGIYAAANKYSLIFTSLYSIFDMSWTESASAHINSKRRDEFFSSVYNKSFKFFASLAVGLIAVTPFVFHFVVGEEFAEAKLYIPVLILGTFLNAVVSQYSVVYIAKKLTSAVLVTSIASAVISVVLNLILINTIGVMGAAVSLAITFLAMAVWRHHDVKKYVKITFEPLLFIKIATLFAVAFGIYYLDNQVLNIAGIVAITLSCIWFSKDTLTPIFSAIALKPKK